MNITIKGYKNKLKYRQIIENKTGLQPASRPVERVHYFGGWVEGPSKQTDRNRTGGALRRQKKNPQTPVILSVKLNGRFVGKTSLTKNFQMISGVRGLQNR